MNKSKKPQWRERLLASASASTIKIAGVGKKLRNKVIMLRDVLTPPCMRQPTTTQPGWESQFTIPAEKPPNYYQDLLSSNNGQKDPNVSRRIICVRDFHDDDFNSEDDDDEKEPFYSDDKDELRSFTSMRRRKPLSTLQEEDEMLEEDMFIDAVVMTPEKLKDIPEVVQSSGSPDRSRVSPPWMGKHLASSSRSSTLTSLGANPVSRNIDNGIGLEFAPYPSSLYDYAGIRISLDDAAARPNCQNDRPRTVNSEFSSTNDRGGGGGHNYGTPPSIKSPHTTSFFSESNGGPHRASALSGSSFGFNSAGDPLKSSNNLLKQRPLSANFSVTGSMTSSVNGRRRSSLMMLPLPTNGGGARARRTSVSSAASDRRYNGGVSTRPVHVNVAGESESEEDDSSDDTEDGEEQSYKVLEALSAPDSEGNRSSVILLFPITDEERQQMVETELAIEAEREHLQGLHGFHNPSQFNLTSKWSETTGDFERTPRSSAWGTAPSPQYPSPSPPFLQQRRVVSPRPDSANSSLVNIAHHRERTLETLTSNARTGRPPVPPPYRPLAAKQQASAPIPVPASISFSQAKPRAKGPPPPIDAGRLTDRLAVLNNHHSSLPSVPEPVPSPGLAPKTLSVPPPKKPQPQPQSQPQQLPTPGPSPPTTRARVMSSPIQHHSSLRRSRSSLAMRKAVAMAAAAQAGGGGAGLTRVRSASTASEISLPSSTIAQDHMTKSLRTAHLKSSSETFGGGKSKGSASPQQHRKRRSEGRRDRLPTPVGVSTTASPKVKREKSLRSRAESSQSQQQQPPPADVTEERTSLRMANQNDEFLRSSGRAFAGQNFRAIQVLDEMSGAMEVHVGKGRKASDHERVRTSISAPSFPSSSGSSADSPSRVRPRPSM